MLFVFACGARKPTKHLQPARVIKRSRTPTRRTAGILDPCFLAFLLGVNSALPDRIGYSVNRQHISCDPVVYRMRFRIPHYIVECRNHDVRQPLIHFRLFPEIALTILHHSK